MISKLVAGINPRRLTKKVTAMKRYILFWMATVALVLSSCTKDETGEENPIGGNEINFGMVDTRTIYGEQQSDKSWPVYWSAGDQIKIYCAQTPQGSAVYATDGDGSSPAANISKTTNPLTWNEQGGVDHTFYAIYPASDKITVDENGIANFPIIRNQKATVENTDGYSANVVAQADMTNQYMVATSAVNPADLTDGTVWLGFKPIMTTLDVVITAADGDQNSASAARVTGISIASTITTNSTASKENFYYDIAGGAITSNGATSAGSATEQTETTFVGLYDKSGNATYVDMANGKTLTITVFLPPMSKEVAAQLGRKVKVRVHATGNTELVASLKTNDKESTNWTTQLAPGSKSRVKLPEIPSVTSSSSNNWMTPLDNNIYVSQLSIPGTHDSATKECGLSQGRCQDFTIAEQLAMGIRVFDLRPTSDLTIYHGEISCSITLQEVWEAFNDFLDANPGEFIFAIVKWESEGDTTLGLGLGAYATFNSNMLAFTAGDVYKKYALPHGADFLSIKKDLTIGDMRPEGTFTVDGVSVTRRQGRILTFLRPNQDVHMYNNATTVEKQYVIFGDIKGEYCDTYITGADEDAYSPDGMLFYTNFPGSLTNRVGFVKKKFVDYTSTSNGGNGLGQMPSQSVSIPTNWTMYCQNYYQVSSGDEETKIAAVKETMDQATSFANAAVLEHTWVINHCSGYVGSALESTAYAELSNVLNPEIYEYIQNRTTHGALGMVLVDFAGSEYSSASTTLKVYGDLLPQTIIDYNYKYRMKRKGE